MPNLGFKAHLDYFLYFQLPEVLFKHLQTSLSLRNLQFICFYFLFDTWLFVCSASSPVRNIRAALLIDLFDHSAPQSSKWGGEAGLLLRPSGPDSQIF